MKPVFLILTVTLILLAASCKPESSAAEGQDTASTGPAEPQKRGFPSSGCH